MEQANKRSLLPAFVKKAFMLVWTNIVPQIILFICNLNFFWLVWDEIDPKNMPRVWVILITQVLLVLIPFAVWLWERKKPIDLSWKWCIFFLLSHIAYLWYAMAELSRIMPGTIEPWILDQGLVVLCQFSFMMPALFYAGLRLSCFDTQLDFAKDIGRSIIIAVAVPALYYALSIGFGIGGIFLGAFSGMMFLAFMVTATVLTLIAIIRSAVLFYTWFQKKDRVVHLIATGLVALIGPLAGLALNRTIPFPYNFQDAWVYVFAAMNGLVLLVPAILQLKGPGQLFLKSVTYPFTTYFFLVFLPFTPISLIAMLAMGAGILILVPTVLFLLHTKLIIRDYKICVHAKGIKFAIISILLGLLVLPTYLFASAMTDRIALHKALDYVYKPDYAAPHMFPGSPHSVKRVLIKMKQVKEGVQMPYITQIYNQLVFDNLVLPDSKIEYMYQMFAGQKMPEYIGGGMGWGMLRGRQSAARIRGAATRVVERNVDLVSVDVSTVEDADITTAYVRMVMKDNRTGAVTVEESATETWSMSQAFEASEFAREIQLPQGVLVTGFSLKVGKDMVPGQIFEKKTAMWVYHMIRDFTQRDPGLLVYQSPTQLNFNVYPFRRGEERTAEIEFQFPKGFSPQIKIGEETVSLIEVVPEKTNPTSLVMTDNMGGNTFVLAPQDIVSKLPTLKRTPYLHFILDYSKGTDAMDAIYAKRIMEIASQFPDAKGVKITAANFESESLTNGIVQIKKDLAFNAIIRKRTLPSRGSLDLEGVLKRALLSYSQESAVVGKDALWQQYPVFIVVSNERDTVLEVKNIAFFGLNVPEITGYFISLKGSELEEKLLWPKTESPQKEVVALKIGQQIRMIPVGSDPQLAAFDGIKESPELMVYHSIDKKFIPQETLRLSDHLSFTQGLNLLRQSYQEIHRVSQTDATLPSLVQSSKDTGVLIPSTAYIVVERSSQWKALNQFERKKLKAHQAFDFEETQEVDAANNMDSPEPAFWILLAFVVFWVGTEKYRMRESVSKKMPA